MFKLAQLENISVKFRELLLRAGVADQQQLLAACKTRSGRDALAKQTSINPKLILKWVQQADLSRINGIGPEYAELLVQSGITSTQVLARLSTPHVLQSLQEHNEKTNWVKTMPSEANIESWIQQAQTLPLCVE